MYQVLEAIYNLLCFLDEDAKAHNLIQSLNLPDSLKEAISTMTDELEKFLAERSA